MEIICIIKALLTVQSPAFKQLNVGQHAVEWYEISVGRNKYVITVSIRKEAQGLLRASPLKILRKVKFPVLLTKN